MVKDTQSLLALYISSDPAVRKSASYQPKQPQRQEEKMECEKDKSDQHLCPQRDHPNSPVMAALSPFWPSLDSVNKENDKQN